MTDVTNLPPQDLDAERAVIGSILLFEDLFDDVQSTLRPEMFYLDAHTKIYRELLAMREKGIGIDAETLRSRLVRVGKLEEIGGVEYLAKCLTAVPHAAHAKYHASQVRDRWTQRQVIYTCTELLRDAYRGQHDGIELAMKAVDQITKVTEQQNQGGRWLQDVAMEAMDRHLSEEPEAISTGFLDIDRMIKGLRPAQLTIVAGRPSMGKTALAGAIAENVAGAGGTVAFFSLEMRDAEVLDRMTLKLAKTCFNQLQDMAKQFPDEVQKAVYQLGALPIYINDNATQSVASITAECRRVKRIRGLSLVIIDYLQLLEPEDKRAPVEQQVGQASWRLKQLSKSLSVPVICLSQLSRKCESRPDKKPIMSDLRDSGQVEQNADTIMLPFRPAVYFPDEHKENEVELIIPKNRGGKVGSVNLLWDGPTMTFSGFKEDDTALDLDSFGF